VLNVKDPVDKARSGCSSDLGTPRQRADPARE
jgi:hypothetical protein